MKKVILVTGAASGIGKATVLKFLAEGHIVYATGRNIEDLKKLELAGARVLYIDVTDDETMSQGVKHILDKESRIDILVNNAGYGLYGSVEDVDMDKVRRQFEVNLFGLGRMTQLVLPSMRQNKSGLIVNISSIGGKIYTPLGDWYHATKHAVEGLSDCLRLELKPFNIKVVIIEPGAIASQWSNVATEQLMETSGNGAYKNLAQVAKKMMEDTYVKKSAASPDVIADIIYKASISKNPKTRYTAPFEATAFVFLRRILPDKVFDFALAKMLAIK